MPLRPRFGPLGGSDVVDALLCSSPRAQTPEAWSPCGTPLHGRIDLSRRLTDVTTLAFLHAQRGFCVRAICAARASQGSNVTGPLLASLGFGVGSGRQGAGPTRSPFV